MSDDEDDDDDDEPTVEEVTPAPAAAAAPAPAPAAPPPAPPSIKHDWYQTPTHVTMSIMQKNVKDDELTVDMTEDFLKISLVIAGKEEKLDLKLCDKIAVDESKFTIKGTKVEFKLKKQEKKNWGGLTFGSGRGVAAVTGSATTMSTPYASKKDWNKVNQDLKKAEDEEKPEGEEALQKLFKDIYGKANEDTRRAMNKSFQTSGGTVLSTNWGEVGTKDYEEERTAPDGMKWKKWG